LKEPEQLPHRRNVAVSSNDRYCSYFRNTGCNIFAENLVFISNSSDIDRSFGKHCKTVFEVKTYLGQRGIIRGFGLFKRIRMNFLIMI
jgi:hypothetical protein